MNAVDASLEVYRCRKKLAAILEEFIFPCDDSMYMLTDAMELLDDLQIIVDANKKLSLNSF